MNDAIFRLHMLLSTRYFSATKLDSVVYSRHGGTNQQDFWYQNRNEKLVVHNPDDALNNVDIRKTQITVYVKEVSEDMDKLRSNYLVYMDGQKYVVCRDHKLHLIAPSKRGNKFTHRNLPRNTIRGKKE